MSEHTQVTHGSADMAQPQTAASDTWQPTDYSVSSEDQPLADEIRGMDALSLPSSGSIKGAVQFGSLKASSLPPALQAEVAEEIATYPDHRRDSVEGEAVQTVLNRHRASIRARAGLSADALPYHHEMMEIATDYRALAAEFDRNAQRLDDIHEFTKEVDPETGEVKSVAQFRLSGRARDMLFVRQDELNHQMRLLMSPEGEHGPEAKRRLAAAMQDSIAKLKAQRGELEEHREAQRRADEIAREERINAKAQAFAKGKRNQL